MSLQSSEKMNRVLSCFTISGPAILFASVACLCAINLNPEGWARQMLHSAVQGDFQVADFDFDELFARRMPSGNVWLRFEGFSPEQDAGLMAMVYYRWNYAIYPRRIYVSYPSTVINNGKTMPDNDDMPSSSVLKELGIEWVTVFSKDPHGKINIAFNRY